MFLQPLSVDVSSSWRPYLLASLFLRTFFSWQSLLSTSHSLDTVFFWHQFPGILWYFTFFWRLFLLKLCSFGTFCLDTFFVLRCFFILGISFYWHFRTLLTKSILCTTKLAKKKLHHKTCTKYFPALLRTTKVPQNTSQYFVLLSLHIVLPSTASYYKTCTKYFPVPVLLRTTKFAQSTSQYYFVLQRWHKVLPSTTSYDKTCAKCFPVLLCTTRLAQNTSQFYFVLQNTSQYYFVLKSLHSLLPSTNSTAQGGGGSFQR